MAEKVRAFPRAEIRNNATDPMQQRGMVCSAAKARSYDLQLSIAHGALEIEQQSIVIAG